MTDKGIIIAAVIIALALALTNHYSISAVGSTNAAYRVNTFTGSVVYCYMSGCREIPQN